MSFSNQIWSFALLMLLGAPTFAFGDDLPAGDAGYVDPIGDRALPLGEQDTANAVGRILQVNHLSAPSIKDRRFVEKAQCQFSDRLDPDKLFFVQSDVSKIKALPEKLGKKAVDLSRVDPIYNAWVERYRNRITEIRSLLSGPFDWDKTETIPKKEKWSTYSKDDLELNARWKIKLKYELVRLISEGLSEEQARKSVGAKYEQMFKVNSMLPRATRVNLYLDSMACCLDPHSCYLPPAKKDLLVSNLNLDYVGMGLDFEMKNDNELTITGIKPKGPAARSGTLAVGDVVVEVENEEHEKREVNPLSPLDVFDHVPQTEGVSLTLAVRSPIDSKVKHVVLRQERVELGSK